MTLRLPDVLGERNGNAAALRGERCATTEVVSYHFDGHSGAHPSHRPVTGYQRGIPGFSESQIGGVVGCHDARSKEWIQAGFQG